MTRFLLDTPQNILGGDNYYKLVLTGEQSGKDLHATLSQYLTATDPKARSALALKVSHEYRAFISGMAPRAASGALIPQKQMLLRFAALSPTLLTPEQIKIFDSVIPTNTTGEPIYYLDEWLRDIARGELALSSEDGVTRPVAAVADPAHMQELKSKHSATLENITSELAVKNHRRQQIETTLAAYVSSLTHHQTLPNIDNYGGPYTEAQLRTVQEINHRTRDLLQLDTEIRSCVERYHLTSAAMGKVEKKLTVNGEAVPGLSVEKALKEMEGLGDMLDMLIGPTGNPFPLLSKEFYHLDGTTTGFREIVLDMFAKTEAIDPNVFCRIHKDIKRRIVPEVLLLPSYGGQGICLYALTKSNPVSSRGRLVLPLYPTHLQTAVLAALGQLRWQAAKAKASSYWMTEGLTGVFYDWYIAQNHKGDPEEAFVRAYVNWITKEAVAAQALDRGLREIFWRHIPFPESLKEQLARHNVVYQELLTKLG